LLACGIVSKWDARQNARMTNPHAPEGKQPGLPTIDVTEYGGKKDGERQAINRRLFMQLVVFDVPEGQAADATSEALARELRTRRIGGVVYADTMQPRGVGLLTWSEDPAHFVRAVRPLFGAAPLDRAVIRPSFGMIGRTYATGHEPDLEFVLLRRSIENVMNEAYPWHVWYPLRRTGAFARLEPAEQGSILREHAQIGMAYGQQELAHDIRLACHGLDAEDNEFVIGLVGRELHPLSHLVQTMRKTKQTSEFIAKMGPFFIGHVAHRSG
jgi:chlorite dismutase